MGSPLDTADRDGQSDSSSSSVSPSLTSTTAPSSRMEAPVEWQMLPGVQTVTCPPKGRARALPADLPPLVLVVVVETECVIKVVDLSGALLWAGPGTIVDRDREPYSLNAGAVLVGDGGVTVNVDPAARAGPAGCRTSTPIGDYLDVVFCYSADERGIRTRSESGTWSPILIQDTFERRPGDASTAGVLLGGGPKGARRSPDGSAIAVTASMECESPLVRVLEADGTGSTAFGGIDGASFPGLGWTPDSELLIVRWSDGVCGASGKAGVWAIARDGSERRVWWEPGFEQGAFLKLAYVDPSS